jgi:RsiW-degrading membrane proteinase PrsW (M82 family)
MLLHTVSSATIGLFIGFNFFDKPYEKYFWTVIGLVAAIIIHSVFNFFMMSSGTNSLVVLEVIWIAVIMVLFILEKIKRIRLEKIEQ